MRYLPVKVKLLTNKEIIKYIEKNFSFSLQQFRKIISNFHSEMIRGLRGEKSSLKMLPAYVDKSTGSEIGEFVSLDIGGTNFRILRLNLKGKGKVIKLGEKKVVLERKYTRGTGSQLFDFIAQNIKNFLIEEKIDLRKELNVGFTFSFPVKQTGVASGILLHWTKDFSAKDVIGAEVVCFLNSSLKKQGLNNIKIRALVNDTVGTLATQSYKDRDCDIAVILGTGTNACYRERNSEIIKWKAPKMNHSIINIEWGNFNKLETTVYDQMLDKKSDNPGSQILEKMVSGMYLGEIARLIMKDLINRRMLFGGKNPAAIVADKSFKTEYLSKIESDNSIPLSSTKAILEKIGILESSKNDRILVKKICGLVLRRAAGISASALAAVAMKIDPVLSGKHTVAIDGSVYEKSPGFSRSMKSVLRKIFAKKRGKVNLVLTKDGSGIGAAILAGAVLSNFCIEKEDKCVER